MRLKGCSAAPSRAMRRGGAPNDQHVFTDLINLGGLLPGNQSAGRSRAALSARARPRPRATDPTMSRLRALNSLGALLRETQPAGRGRGAAIAAHCPLTESFGYDPHVASTLGNLAGLLQDSNRLEEAEALYRRALALKEKSFGPDHPNVAIPLNNLATLLQHAKAVIRSRNSSTAGRSPSARRSYRPDHPGVATRLGNLADLLHDTDQAGRRRAPDAPCARYRREARYGPDHPKVAKGLSNLARLLKDTDRVAEAGTLGATERWPSTRRATASDHSQCRHRSPTIWPCCALSKAAGRSRDACYARAKPTLIGRGRRRGAATAGLAEARR